MTPVTGFLRERFAERPDRAAVVAPPGRCTFGELAELQDRWGRELDRRGVGEGAVVALAGDFTPATTALLLALLDRAAIVVPQSNVSRVSHGRGDEISQVELRVDVDRRDAVTISATGRCAQHDLYDELRRRGSPGVVAFTSGTSGEPKAAVHDFARLLEKVHARRAALSTFAFLLYDHLGGVRTLFHALSNGVTLVASDDRSPDTVCALIEEHRVELLPATPTFFNLLLLSGAHRRHDLGSLRAITYGTEPMPQSTLDRLRAAFPGVRLQQTYGLIELGPLGSRSRDDGSLWMKVGGDGFETRVVDGVLQVRSRAMAMGYLNAEAPITEDGWFVTGDAVQQDGEYVRVLGRRSELINVGGEKVFPAEVEDVIQAMDEVAEVRVHGERNAIVGNIVCATVLPAAPDADPADLARAVKDFCRPRLERFKVPVRVRVTAEPLHGERFKKTR
ncbi:MAG: long-chain fatty acid--CoA ligase [Solirubrobacterales bacterium]|nr:long-chain fatty acid--CoA ligase [Solirubrobacterales bacterium]